MNKISKFLSLALLAILATAVLSMPEVQAEEGTCNLQATNTDVFIIVFDMDREGNKGKQIWQGRINVDESVKITAPHARFVYDYNSRPDEDQPLSGGTERWCNNDETVLVP